MKNEHKVKEKMREIREKKDEYELIDRIRIDGMLMSLEWVLGKSNSLEEYFKLPWEYKEEEIVEGKK